MDPLSSLNAALGVGTEPKDLTLLNVALRGAIIFMVGVVAVRLGMTRFTGKEAPFDILLTIVLGAVLSRTINGSAPFWPTIATGFLLIGMHAVMARISYHWDGFGHLVKGKPEVLVRDGVPDQKALRRRAISKKDLDESLRLQNIMDLASVQEARLERNGTISVVKRQ